MLEGIGGAMPSAEVMCRGGGSREEQRGADRKGYKSGQSYVKRGWSVCLSVPEEPSLSCLLTECFLDST